MLATFARDYSTECQRWCSAQVAAGKMTQVEADADVRAWQWIRDLLDNGAVELPFEHDPRAEWRTLLAAAESALDRRMTACASQPTAANEAKVGALHKIRNLLLRHAIRAGALERPPEQRIAA